MAEGGGRAVRVARELVPHLPQLLPGLQSTLYAFSIRLLQRWALRFAEACDPAAAAAVQQPQHGQYGQQQRGVQQQQQQQYGAPYRQQQYQQAYQAPSSSTASGGGGLEGAWGGKPPGRQ